MNEYNLCCNIPKCKMPLYESAWVTRCMHVFCQNHGQAYFSNPSPQISCPICNEINLKEVDILNCEVNPSDMVLAGITPERAIMLAAKTLKLWWFQIQQQHYKNNLKITELFKKNSDMKHYYNKMFNKVKHKYDAEISALKSNGHSLVKKIENINIELDITKKELLKYKNAFNSKQRGSLENIFTNSLSPNWLADDNSLHIPLPPAARKHKNINFSVIT